METPTQNSHFIPVASVQEAPENWTILYRPPTEDDESWMQLRESIAENGILTPIIVSADSYVISGHRRLRAAMAEGLENIPVIVQHKIWMAELSKEDRLKLLANNNRGSRIKTTAEIFMEEAVQIAPEAAIREAQERKAQDFTKAKCSEVFGEEAA
jgi:ParB/RepB/Spo0J family partition protein